MTLDYDIIVIGGGHAGCEAASAAARLGSRTLLLTMDLTKLASMSCNPAIGGVAKGQIVREIDALGGCTGIVADRTTIQFRMLNRSKGAAMWSPRAQCDKTRFSEEWRRLLENTVNLYLWQDVATELLFEPADAANTPAVADAPLSEFSASTLRVCGVRTRMGVEFRCKSVILTAGTFLEGLMHCGASHAEGGRAGDAASHGLTACLRAVGFESGRMKTGTPARLDARTIDFEALEPQYGDEQPSKFSFSSETQPVKEQLPCFSVYTTPEVHATLRSGFDRSPLFNGTIQGIGPRYCPSIEDKLRTFADKEQHQLFLEPEGRSTNEYYLNGFSSSLPWEVQWQALHQMRGLEDVHIFRPGYAIEYDYFPPTQLHHSLETKLVAGLFFAGQINGTTGYEEAAAQGLLAGINAHRQLTGAEPVVLKRDEAYIGVLIDDLVTKGVDEPYRMFTSRAEYRILLRQDNADARLTPLGHEIGLISRRRYEEFAQKKSLVESLISFAHERSIKAAEINDYLISVGSEPLTQGKRLHEVLMRNNVTFDSLRSVIPALDRFICEHEIGNEVIEEAEIRIKYRGYIEREKFIADKLHRLENIRIPADFDYHAMQALTIEARQKLSRIRPATIGQASCIPGVSPADINVLLVKFGR
ncbi:MAG: tRNA uridine-5-carboxymethylaminomethyl(34) synthesis enzyme MnmG [Alistipes sp.]|nr:tRNA uridine-5-carboxymethylaminomethyl(34) synthesis enzyme MnmG [Alistipes sp.]